MDEQAIPPSVTKPQRTPEQQAIFNERMRKLREAKARKRAERAALHPLPPIAESADRAMGVDDPIFVPLPAPEAPRASVSDNHVVPSTTPEIQSLAFEPPPAHPQRESLADRSERNARAEWEKKLQNSRPMSEEDARHIRDTRRRISRPVAAAKAPTPPARDPSSERSLFDYISLTMRGVALSFALWLTYRQLTNGDSTTDGAAEGANGQGDVTVTSETNGSETSERVVTSTGGRSTSVDGRGGIINRSDNQRQPAAFLDRRAVWTQ